MKRSLFLLVCLAFIFTGCDLVVDPTVDSTVDSTVDGNLIDSKWYTGTTAPAASLGSDGDLYMNTLSGDIYVKTGGTWDLVSNIQGPAGEDGPAGPGIEYWVHTITSDEVTYIPDVPWGYYQLIIYYPEFEAGNWIDVWITRLDGSISRPVPVWDSALLMWYLVIYIYDGTLKMNCLIDLTGFDLLIFHAPATYVSKAVDQFDIKEYFLQLVY